MGGGGDKGQKSARIVLFVPAILATIVIVYIFAELIWCFISSKGAKSRALESMAF